MTNDSTTLTILSTAIRQDGEGRYCLNDCHKAAGGEKSKQVSNFLRLDTTRALVAEISRSSDVRSAPAGAYAELHTPSSDVRRPHEGHAGKSVSPLNIVNDGKNNGTYAVKELVYAYAMWISPAFHLRVIQAFDALVTGQVPRSSASIKSPNHATLLRKAIALHGSLFVYNKRQGMDLTQARTKANAQVLEQMGVDLPKECGWQPQPLEVQEQTLTATQIGVMLGGMKAQDVNKLLEERGLHTSGRDMKGRKVWMPTPVGRAFGRYEDKAKAHAGGTVQPWVWYPSVVERLRGFTKAPESVS